MSVMMRNCQTGIGTENSSSYLSLATQQKGIEIKGELKKGYCAMDSSPTQSIFFDGFHASVDEDFDASMNSDAVSIADTDILLECKSMGAIEEDSEASADLDDAGRVHSRSSSGTNRHHVQDSRRLRLVEGRLQVVGFASDSNAKTNSVKPKMRARSQKSFWDQVMFYVLK
jgi:hypothetical protein